MPDSSNSKSTSLVAIDFHGDQIVTFQHEGAPHVAVRRLVENLGLSWGGQSEKLVAAGAKFSCSVIRTTGADGKAYDMLAMPVAKLPLWLASINPNKIPNLVKRAKIELYQAESAIALHDYWTKGVAVRSDMDGVITSLDPSVMKAIGGMVKGIVGKAIQELLPQMVEREVLANHASVARGMTAGEVLDEAGVRNRKGCRGMPRRVSDALRRYAAQNGIVVTLASLGSSTAYIFDPSLVRDWLRNGGGKQFIDRIVEEKRGQGRFTLVSAK